MGTYGEVRFAVSKAIEKKESGYLLTYYQEHYPLELIPDYTKAINSEHHIPSALLSLLEEEIKKYVS